MSEGAIRPGSPPVLLFVGTRSGAGKTTLLERVIPLLGAEGLRVAAVKLTHHDVELDVPGKDSRRLRDAGATPALLAGPGRVTLFHASGDAARPEVASLARLAAAAAPVDLVLVEGGGEEPGWPRVEVVAPGAPVRTADAALLVAVVTDDDDAPAPRGVPRYAQGDAEGLARLIASWARPSGA